MRGAIITVAVQKHCAAKGDGGPFRARPEQPVALLRRQRTEIEDLVEIVSLLNTVDDAVDVY
jgi:hypothetical protein